MTFRDELEQDATLVFCNTDEFAETITWDTGGAGEKQISAVINRAQLDTFGQERDRTIQRRAEILVSMEDVPEFPDPRQGETKVTFNKVADDDTTAVDWIVTELVHKDDPGLFRMEVVAGR